MGHKHHQATAPGIGRGVRVTLLIALSGAILGTGVWLSLPRAPARSGDADFELVVTMGGFSPRQLKARAGRPARLRLVNPDSPYHADGGGVHGFTVPDLGIDVQVPPHSTMEIDLPAAAPGEYPFYCDTCCGGKENPFMQGVLKVEA
ncbi:MAG: cupredoxin domain-containing protein [Bacillota bacterium]